MNTAAKLPDEDTDEWLDRQGRKVPLRNVKPVDRMKDEVARRLVAGAKTMQAEVRNLKYHAMSEVLAAKGLIFEECGVTVGGDKGNIKLSSYDGSYAVEISVNENLMFGPEIEAAKKLIDECIEDWTANGNPNARALLEHAFQVNKSGRIDTGRVLGLRKLRMTTTDGEVDQRWVHAMDVIADAVITTDSVTYVRFYEKNPLTGKMDPVSLNIATL